MDKENVWCIYTVEYYLSFVENAIVVQEKWVLVEVSMLDEISQIPKDKYFIISQM